MNFAFWNINRKDLTDAIVELVNENEIDVIFIAESNLKPSYILNKLNSKGPKYFYCPSNVCDKILVYSKFKDKIFPLLQDSPRIFARQLHSNKLNQSITIICLHYQSKVNWNNEDQAAHSTEMKLFIDSVENLVGHKRTIVCGDFNMHPFDNGIIQSTGFHTTMDRNIAKKFTRKIGGKDYDYFYNPMWGFLGDLGRGKVSGTIYYSPAKPINYHWNLFDQVLIRPELIDYFDDDFLDIITNINSISLLNSSNIIDDIKFSDHLPIKFSVHI